MIMEKIESKFLALARRIVDIYSVTAIKKNSGLWDDLNEYIKKSKSTGCNFSDYWELYKFVRNKKPKEILECGTGVSTIVMAYALLENKKEGYAGRITSLEENEEYYNMAKKLVPEKMKVCVEIVFSTRKEDYYSIFRGVRYSDVPDRPYDFVFVDGPNYVAPSDGMVTFDFDYIDIVRKADHPVYGIIDKRVSTCYVLQKIFGLDKIKYNSITHLGFLGPCTKYDLKQINHQTPSIAFSDSFKLFGNTELKLKL